MSHEASGEAVHVQFGCVVTVVVTVPPAMHRLTSTGATEYWQPPVSLACLTVKVWSATLIAAVRSVVSRLRATR